jgi:hypothetical protein
MKFIISVLIDGDDEEATREAADGVLSTIATFGEYEPDATVCVTCGRVGEPVNNPELDVPAWVTP